MEDNTRSQYRGHRQTYHSFPDVEPEVCGPVNRRTEDQERRQWMPPLITVEPALCLYVLAGALMYPAGAKLWYDRVCSSHYSEEICLHIDNGSFPDEENTVQTETALWNLWQRYCIDFPAMAITFILGSISDKYSRKLAIAIPCFGQALYAVNLIVNEYFKTLPPGYLLIGPVIGGLTGGWMSMYMACFAYIGVVTREEEKTKKILIVEALQGVITAIALFASGYVLNATSFQSVFIFSGSAYIIAVIYSLVFIKDPPKDDGGIEVPFCTKLKQMCRDSFTTLFKRRSNNGRVRVLVTLLIALTAIVSNKATVTLAYQYLKKYPLSWGQVKYGIFLALYMGVPYFVLLCFTPFLKKCFRLHDTTIWFIGITSASLSEILFGCSTHDWMVFLVPVIGCLREASNVVRALLAKLISNGEMGNVYAILGVAQALSGMLAGTIYESKLYPATLNIWPGLSFIVGASFSIIPLCLLLWLRKDMKRQTHALLEETDSTVTEQPDYEGSRPAHY